MPLIFDTNQQFATHRLREYAAPAEDCKLGHQRLQKFAMSDAVS